METLLRNNFTTHYRLPICNEPDLVIQTNELYFEIEDTAVRAIALHTIIGSGVARFSNPNTLLIKIANYDKFVTSLPNTFQHGRKRCDILLTSQSQFILGELKNRYIGELERESAVRICAQRQLEQSLVTLLAVSQIAALAKNKDVRKCCYFNKQASSPPLINATIAFNRLSTIFRDGLQMTNTEIETHEFEYWEYLGAQTLTLT